MGSAVPTVLLQLALQLVPFTVARIGCTVSPGITICTSIIPSPEDEGPTVPVSTGWLFVVASAAAVTVGLLLSGRVQVSVFWNVNVVAVVFHGRTICSTPTLSYW